MSIKSSEFLVHLLRKSHATLVVAESLTGGMLADSLVAIPGASDAFEGGIVSYSNNAKKRLLGVSQSVLDEPGGAIQAVVAEQMAIGALQAFGLTSTPKSPKYALATTGVAGPAEISGIPVGRVFIGFTDGEFSSAAEYQFQGDRASIRRQTVQTALELSIKFLQI